MTRETTPLGLIIIAAEAGDEQALDSLSKIALGGNKTARQAIHKIEASNWQPRSEAQSQSIVWPNKHRGPKKGDIPQHLNV